MRSAVLRSENRASGIQPAASANRSPAMLRGKLVGSAKGARPSTRDKLEQSLLGKREERGSGLLAKAKSSRDQLRESFLSPAQAFQKATSGQARELPFRAEMERLFGASFKHVKAHFGDKESAEGLAHLNARGVAQGNVVVFSAPNPTKEMVAHELAHVVQNMRGGHQNLASTSQMGREGDANEREAHKAAKQASSGQAIEIEEHGGAGLHLDAVDGAFNAEQQSQELLHLTANISNTKERLIAIATRLSKMYGLNAMEKTNVLSRVAAEIRGGLVASEKPQSYDLEGEHCAFRILKGLATILFGVQDTQKKGQYTWRDLL